MKIECRNCGSSKSLHYFAKGVWKTYTFNGKDYLKFKTDPHFFCNDQCAETLKDNHGD